MEQDQHQELDSNKNPQHSSALHDLDRVRDGKIYPLESVSQRYILTWNYLF